MKSLNPLTLLFKKRSYALLMGLLGFVFVAQASSYREAPLISNDPLADNTDLYAFRSPDDPNTITIIANYIPGELPFGGPNYYTFGENIRYEIHIDNDVTTAGDDITYRFTFTRENQDPTTFFNIRLGQQNLKTTYTLERSMGGGAFMTIVSGGIVPPNDIGPRSIESGVGLGTTYEELIADAITTDGETIFIEGEDLSVFPNPVSDNLTVEYKTKGQGTMRLIHASGAEVKAIPLRAGHSAYTVEMNDLADGFYLLRIEEEGQLPVTQQVIKQGVK